MLFDKLVLVQLIVMEYLFHNYNNENICFIIPYGGAHCNQMIDWSKKVWNKFGISVNYMQSCNTHGVTLNRAMQETINSSTIIPSYYIFMESDSIFLKREAIDITYDFIKNKKTIFGIAWGTAHKGNPTHVHAGPAFCAFSTQLYLDLEKPNLEPNDRSDTCAELSYKAKEKGYIISLIYPSHVIKPSADLNGHCRFGMGNTYSDLVYHSSRQDDPDSPILFIEKCKEILNET